MQTDYLFNGLKGYIKLRNISYLWDMTTKEANERYKILQFCNKYGLDATIEAFNISKRTIYRWKSILKENNNDITSLNPKSTKPKTYRKSLFSTILVDEIKRLREIYPNIGKAKLYILLQSFCNDNNIKLPSISTIGRIIANDKNKMRLTPYRIDRNGKVKTIKKREFKNTSKVLEALIDGVTYNNTIKNKFTILSDNGSEFKKEFDNLLQQRSLTHYWTYPNSPKMNAHNERFNRTIQEQFINYHEDLLFSDIQLFNENG